MIRSPLKQLVYRNTDPTGNGWYGASRGRRKHRGVDLVAEPGTTVYSPIHGTITKIGYPYADALQFRYVEITAEVYRIWLMYVEPKPGIEVGQKIFIGDEVGTVQAIGPHHHPHMKNHLHIQVWKNGLLTDPQPIIKEDII